MIKITVTNQKSQFIKNYFDFLPEKIKNPYIKINGSEIKIKLQNGPIKEMGENGASVDIIGELWLEILRGLNEKFKCRENSLSIQKIEEALGWQNRRLINRKKRNIEGYDKE